MTRARQTLFLLSCLLLASSSQAELFLSQQAENRLIRQIQQNLVEAELKSLGSTPYYAIVQSPLDQQTQAKGGIIIVHEPGAHADWQTLIQPLRRGLPAYGWNTLSLQLPVLERPPTTEEHKQLQAAMGPRLQAALDYFKQLNVSNIIIIAHGLSSRLVARSLKESSLEQRIKAYVALDSPAMVNQQLDALTALTVPLLHVQPPTPGASLKVQPQKKPGDYRRLVINYGGHGDNNSITLLIKRTRSWLQRYAADATNPPAAQ